MAKKKTTVDNPVKNPVRRVRPPQGGAAIVPGNPGNSGGKPGRSGRPKSEVREACQAAFDEAVPVLRAMVLGKLPDVSTGDRIRAADVLGRYGGMTFTETEAKLDLQPAAEVRKIFEIPSNGRERGPEPDRAEWTPPQSSRPAARSAARPAPQNGGGDVILPNGKRGYRWRDGTLRVIPEEN